MTKKQIMKRLEEAGFSNVRELLKYGDESYALGFNNDLVDFRLSRLSEGSNIPYRVIKRGLLYSNQPGRGHTYCIQDSLHSPFGLQCELGIG